MDERFRWVEQIEHRVEMLPGVFTSHGVLPLEFKPAYSVGDLLLQHLEALEQEAEEKGGVQQVLADHFTKIPEVTLSLAFRGLLLLAGTPTQISSIDWS